MSIAKYELNCILADQIDLVKAQKDPSYRHAPANTSNSFKPRLFRHHNPTRRKTPQKAVDVFPRTVTEGENWDSHYLRRHKTHFRRAAKHRESPYSSRFSGAYLFFIFCIKTTHSTWQVLGNNGALSVEHPVGWGMQEKRDSAATESLQNETVDFRVLEERSGSRTRPQLARLADGFAVRGEHRLLSLRRDTFAIKYYNPLCNLCYSVIFIKPLPL